MIPPKRIELISALLGLLSTFIAAEARAASANISLTADTKLRFGTFVAFNGGSRTVSATGVVTNDRIWPVTATGSGQGSGRVSETSTGPAQFTLTYDRGNGDHEPLSLTIQLILLAPAPVAITGVSGSLSGFDTDLPGVANLQPGQSIPATISNCTTRLCTLSFHIGARLDVSRSGAGASLSMAIPLSAVLVRVED